MLQNLAAVSVPVAALDDAIREEYRQFSIPVDQIVSDPADACGIRDAKESRLVSSDGLTRRCRRQLAAYDSP